MGRVSFRPHPAQAPRPASRPRWRGGIPRVRGLCLYHRPNVAGGRRHFHWVGQGAAKETLGAMNAKGFIVITLLLWSAGAVRSQEQAPAPTNTITEAEELKALRQRVEQLER